MEIMQQPERKIIRRIHINTTITTDLKELAEQNNIKMSEALRVGIGVIMADLGDDNYIGGLNVYRKMRRFQELFEDTSRKLEELQKRN
jgi:hypothetical protein